MSLREREEVQEVLREERVVGGLENGISRRGCGGLRTLRVRGPRQETRFEPARHHGGHARSEVAHVNPRGPEDSWRASVPCPSPIPLPIFRLP